MKKSVVAISPEDEQANRKQTEEIYPQRGETPPEATVLDLLGGHMKRET